MKLLQKMPGNIRYVLSVTLLLLVLFLLLRLVFLFFHFQQAAALTWGQTFVGLLMGFRFDLATIFLLNGFIFIILMIPAGFLRRRATYIVANILVMIINLPALAVNAVDIVYYGFAEKRLTHELWTTKEDLVNINFSILIGYWFLFLVFFAVIYVFYRILKKFSDAAVSQMAEEDKLHPVRAWAIPVVSIALLFTGIRGGWPNRPLRIEAAFQTGSHFAGNLGLNSAWTIISAIDFTPSPENLADRHAAIAYTRSQVKNTFDGPFISEDYPLVRKAEFEGPERRYNVVIFLIESFTARHIGIIAGDPPGKSLTPVIDSLAKVGHVYPNFYANSVRSVESLPSVLNSMPEIFMRPCIGSRFETLHSIGIGKMLRSRGYYTAFFCPSRNGTMGFDSYSKISGLEDYFGKDDFAEGDKYFDGLWGVFDGPFMKFMLSKQTQMKKPFLNVYFSCTNHHPFVIPEEGYEDLEKIEGYGMRKTTAYTDRVLGEYLAEARKQPWYDSTIFVLTGDHTFHEKSEADRPYLGNFNVPLVIWGPGIEPGLDYRLGNHINILPTLIEALRLDTYHASAGISLFDSTRHPFVISNLMQVRGLARGKDNYTTTFFNPQAFFQMVNGKWTRKDEMLDDPKADQMENDLRMLYQTFEWLRLNDKWASPEMAH